MKYKTKILKYSSETQKQIFDFAKNLCSLSEIHNFPFKIMLLIKKGYELDDILELTTILNYEILNDTILVPEDKKFNVEIVITLFRSDIAMNFYKNRNDDSYTFSSKTYINDIHEIPKGEIKGYLDKIFVSSNTENLHKLKEFVAEIESVKKTKDNNKIILEIHKKSKTISKDSEGVNLSCPFRRTNGKNKRFEYIVKLAQNTKIAGSKLSSTSAQNISMEIKKINKRLLDKLDLTKNVIKNHDNSGYEIDRDIYELIFA